MDTVQSWILEFELTKHLFWRTPEHVSCCRSWTPGQDLGPWKGWPNLRVESSLVEEGVCECVIFWFDGGITPNHSPKGCVFLKQCCSVHLFTLRYLEIFKVHFDCAGSLKLVAERLLFSTARCSAVHIFGLGDLVITFRGRRKGNLVLWWSKVDNFVAGAGDRSAYTSMCRFRGSRNGGDLRRSE